MLLLSTLSIGRGKFFVDKGKFIAHSLRLLGYWLKYNMHFFLFSFANILDYLLFLRVFLPR